MAKKTSSANKDAESSLSAQPSSGGAEVIVDPGAVNVRRVYALPQEMVDRIVEFQREKGYTSEVEAVRRLLDEALKSRDNLEKIINRFLGQLGQHKSTAVAAGNVLVGHPLVKSIHFDGDAVEFVLKSEEGAFITENGMVSLRPFDRDWRWVHADTPFAPGRIKDNRVPF
jgi:Arc/MetJ-type ribon-helix-helix transcriptional regulator